MLATLIILTVRQAAKRQHQQHFFIAAHQTFQAKARSTGRTET
jgi:hypothetical protein